MNPSNRLPLSADPEKQARIIECLAIGVSNRTAARFVGLHPNTLERFINANPDFRARVNHARDKVKRDYILCIFNAAKTNWRAAAWLLDHPKQHRKWLLALLDQPPHEQQGTS